MRTYALPLFALIDRRKVDLQRPLPEQLAEQLQLWLEAQCRIRMLNAKTLLPAGGEPLLILLGVDEGSLPALLALADVQRTTLYDYHREAEDRFSLAPVALKTD